MFKIDNKFKSANIVRSIRFNDELFENLSKLAQEHGISFNHLVLQCCQYALDNLEKEDKQHT